MKTRTYPRRLPLCATCGKSLHKSARILVCYEDLPGLPQIGTHGGDCCADPLVQKIIYDVDCADAPKLLAQVEARGPSRVTGGRS